MSPKKGEYMSDNIQDKHNLHQQQNCVNFNEEKNKNLNEASYSIYEHDEIFNYEIISKNLIFDQSISANAFRVLCACLSLLKIPGFIIYHSNLMKRLNIGEYAFNKALNNLIESGYVKKINGSDRNRSDTGKFQPNRYIFTQTPKFKNKVPNLVSQPGSPSLGNQGLQNKERKSKETKNVLYCDSGGKTENLSENEVMAAPENVDTETKEYVKPSGEKCTYLLSDYLVYCVRFKPKYETQLIKNAWEALMRKTGPISDPIAFLNMTCENMLKEKFRTVTKSNGYARKKMFIDQPRDQKKIEEWKKREFIKGDVAFKYIEDELKKHHEEMRRKAMEDRKQKQNSFMG